MNRPFFLLVLPSFFFSFPAFADTIDLNSGQTVEGKIIEQTDKYINIDVDGVTMTYYKDEIKDFSQGQSQAPATAVFAPGDDSGVVDLSSKVQGAASAPTSAPGAGDNSQVVDLSSKVQGDTSSESADGSYDYGDATSSTLVGKAWDALGKNDLSGVLAYTNKCISLYSQQASSMQGSLNDYPTGSNDDIFKYWALNDVSVSYYIQGEAYSKAGQKDKAQEAFQEIISNYSFGQCWDPGGWFWKPAEAAQKALAQMKYS